MTMDKTTEKLMFKLKVAKYFTFHCFKCHIKILEATTLSVGKHKVGKRMYHKINSMK